MLNLIGFIVLFPLLGFLILTVFNKKLTKDAVARIGVGSVGISALLTIITGIQFLAGSRIYYTVDVWNWFSVGSLQPGISFYLDSLSLIFMFVITFVGFLIHLYSVEFMREDDGYARFFAYMNLFVGSMLILVMGNNLILLYLGWEGVGLCSFLLIGFWYKEPDNVMAAKKAFVVTRVGDTLMAIGLFLLFTHFGSLQIQKILHAIPEELSVGSKLATWGAILLLGGALGKSAQLPLQTWLPDAMAGPSPVSALIHAATMVTAGVYLIARMNILFIFAPAVMLAVSIIGTATLLIAGFSALAQHDIKKVLAYSTISQIGYMFLALGVGAWSAGIFHFVIHAFFKALLFLGAGAVILSMHHEHNMFKMGGLRKELPVTFWTFLAGSASLAALPLVTAGFYSKDAILWYSFSTEKGSIWLWLGGIIGAFITAVYTFRMIFITFFGEQKGKIGEKPGKLIKIPLIVLGILSIVGGFIELPHNLGHFEIFSGFMEKVFPETAISVHSSSLEWLFQGISAILALSGVYIAYYLFVKKPDLSLQMEKRFQGLKNFLFYGWRFDQLYDRLIVQPVVFLSEINRKDFIDRIYTEIANLNRFLHYQLSKTQTGKTRLYIMSVALGAVIIMAIIILI